MTTKGEKGCEEEKNKRITQGLDQGEKKGTRERFVDTVYKLSRTKGGIENDEERKMTNIGLERETSKKKKNFFRLRERSVLWEKRKNQNDRKKKFASPSKGGIIPFPIFTKGKKGVAGAKKEEERGQKKGVFPRKKKIGAEGEGKSSKRFKRSKQERVGKKKKEPYILMGGRQDPFFPRGENGKKMGGRGDMKGGVCHADDQKKTRSGLNSGKGEMGRKGPRLQRRRGRRGEFVWEGMSSRERRMSRYRGESACGEAG